MNSTTLLSFPSKVNSYIRHLAWRVVLLTIFISTPKLMSCWGDDYIEESYDTYYDPGSDCYIDVVTQCYWLWNSSLDMHVYGGCSSWSYESFCVEDDPPSGGGGGESGGTCGPNFFTAFDGNARREIREFIVPAAVGEPLAFRRFHNTKPREGNDPFGRGGSWRHSWQYDLVRMPVEEGEPARWQLVLPNGVVRFFAHDAAKGQWLASSRFQDRLLETAEGFDVVLAAERTLRFHRVGAGAEERFELRSLVDPLGFVTKLEYDGEGYLARVSDSSGKHLEFTYTDVPFQKGIFHSLATLQGLKAGKVVDVDIPEHLQHKVAHVRLSARKPNELVLGNLQLLGVAEDVPLAATASGNARNLQELGEAASGRTFRAATRSTNRFGLTPTAETVPARIRVIPALGQPEGLEGVQVEVMELQPAQRRVLTLVRGSNGAEVTYDYEVFLDRPTNRHFVVLKGAIYPDGSRAAYRYDMAIAYQRPLLEEADDPRYKGAAKRIVYSYHEDREAGMIRQEINPSTGGVYATLELDPTDPMVRRVSYSDLRTVVFRFGADESGRPLEYRDSLGRVTRFEYADSGKGRLLAKTDHAGRRTEFTYDQHGKVVREVDNGHEHQRITRDESGRVLRKADHAGRETIYERDTKGRITQQHLPSGIKRSFEFDAKGRMVRYTDKQGQASRMVYDERGLPVSRTDAMGRTISFKHDALGRLTETIDALGRTTRRELNDHDQVTKLILPDGTTRQFTYDQYGRKISETDHLGRVTHASYDDLGRVIRRTDAAGRITKYDYTELPQGCGSCNLTTQASFIEYPDGHITTNLFDTEGRLLARTEASGMPEAATTLYAYDNDNNFITATDPLGRVTRYTYDDDNRRLTATDPLGRVTRWAYDRRGNQICVTTPDGGVTRNSYDGMDRLIAVTNAAGHVTRYGYNDLGNITTITDATGKTTRHEYNGKQRTATIGPDGKRESWEFDAVDRLVRSTSAEGVVTVRTYDVGNRVVESQTTVPGQAPQIYRFAYDALGRRASTTDALGRTTRWSYDAQGNVIAVTRPDGLRTGSTFDPWNRKISATDPAGQTTRFDYDAADNLTTLTDARGSTCRFTYDALRRKTAMIYPDGSRELWTYDLAGNLVGYTTRAGQAKTITYNAGNLPMGETWLPAGAAPNVSYQYDGAGRLIGLGNGLAKLTYTHDSLGRVASETSDISALLPGFASHSVSYGFDALGRKSELTYPDGAKVGYAYDARGRVTEISDGPGRAVGRYAYDPLDRIEKLSRDNQVSTEYAYDGAGRLTDVTHAKGREVLVSSHYTLDQLDRRTSHRREDGITETYAYDPAGQLTGVDYGTGAAEAFAYDPAGNRTAVARVAPNAPENLEQYTTNALNQYTQVNGVPFAYDGNGNPIDDGRFTYAYDAQNRLVAVESVAIGGTFRPDATRAEFFYDARNRCVLRKFYSPGNQGQWVLNTTDSRVLTYDTAWNLLTERTLNGTLAGSYVHGPRIDEILQWTGSDWAKLCPLVDGLGSTVALTNQQGRVTERFHFAAFGTPSVLSTGSAYRFLFTGREWLTPVRLNDHRNRYYSPELGRWLNTDPIRFLGGLNLYAYVENSAINFTDHSGLACGSGWNDWVVPDNPCGFNFTSACEAHDACYGTCGKMKQECDTKFREDMGVACGTNTVCLLLANTYHEAVQDFGQSAYNAAQAQSECN